MNNSKTTQEIEKTFKGYIKFNHAEEGKINLCSGRSGFSSLFAMGALELTTKLSKSGEVVHYDYETDKKGLGELIEKSGDVLTNIQEAMTAISIIMTDQENENIKQNTSELAWLLLGLNELSSTTSDNLERMNRTMNICKHI